MTRQYALVKDKREEANEKGQESDGSFERQNLWEREPETSRKEKKTEERGWKIKLATNS